MNYKYSLSKDIAIRGLSFGVLATILGGTCHFVTNNVRSSEAMRERYQSLPAEIRKYDKDSNGSLDAGELENLLRDYEFRKR